jgi:hypothetical protein
MTFALLAIGVILITVAVRGTQDDFVTLLKGDFSGPGNFWWWIAALLIIGAIGYVEKLKPLSDGLLLVILLALVLTRGSPSYPGGGVFQQLTTAMQALNSQPAATTPATPTTPTGR